MARRAVGSILLGLAAACCAVLMTGPARAQAPEPSAQARAACQSLGALRGLSGPLMDAAKGDARAVAQLADRADGFARGMRSDASGQLTSMLPRVDRLERGVRFFVARQTSLEAASGAIQAIRKHSSSLLQPAEEIALEELVGRAPAVLIAATTQLQVLTQRIGKSAGELVTAAGVSPEAAFLLRKDTENFRELALGMRDGSSGLRLERARTPAARDRITRLLEQFEATRLQVDVVFSNLRDLVAASETVKIMTSDLEALDQAMAPMCADPK